MMTIEKAYIRLNESIEYTGKSIDVVREIYDDFENRTCKNCSMYIKEEMKCSFLAITVIDNDFGCSKFVSTDTKGEEGD